MCIDGSPSTNPSWPTKTLINVACTAITHPHPIIPYLHPFPLPNHIPTPPPFLPNPTPIEKYDRISEKKITTSFEQLCKNYPHEFVDYFKYVRQLAFDEKPNYHYMRSLFRDLFERKGYQHDFMFDWTILNFFSKFLYMTPTSNATRVYPTQSVQQIQQEQIQYQLQQQENQQRMQDPAYGPNTQAQQQAAQYQQGK